MLRCKILVMVRCKILVMVRCKILVMTFGDSGGRSLTFSVFIVGSLFNVNVSQIFR